MVFCRQCKQQVNDCPHFVTPLNVASIEVFDPKVKTLAYQAKDQTLEIAFKNGQVWQLFGVKPDIYNDLLHATLSSFLTFIAHRYKAAPVRNAQTLESLGPDCPACKLQMTEQHRTAGDIVRILWKCTLCDQSLWKTYARESVREKRGRYS